MGFFDNLFGQGGADAAREAGNLQYLNQSKAAGYLQDQGTKYAQDYRDLSTRYDPYVSGGNSALARLLGGLGLPGGDGADFSAAYQALPGYQAGINTGVNAIDRSASARSGVNNGATLKALSRFGSDYENQRSGDYLSRLAGLAGSGLTATGQQVGTVGTGLNGQLGADAQSANMMYNAAGTVPQSIIAAQNSQNAGAQNAVNIGSDILGKLLGASGGLGSLGGGGSTSFGGSGAGGFGGVGAGFAGPLQRA